MDLSACYLIPQNSFMNLFTSSAHIKPVEHFFSCSGLSLDIVSLCYTDYIFIIYCHSLPFLWHDTCQTQAYQCPCFAVTFKVEALTSSLISTDLQSVC